MPGFDYDVVDSEIKELECPICFLLMRDAKEMACGHSLCGECLDQWEKKTTELKKSFDCPQCKEPIKKKKVKVSHTINRIITTSIKIRCENKSQGCVWQGMILDIKDHLEKQCQYVSVKCKHAGCNEKLVRSAMSDHIKKNCLYRPILCQFCDLSITAVEVKRHNDVCPKIDISCPNAQCEADIKREELENHLESCMFQSVVCEFSEAGCTEMIPRKSLSIHMQECVQKHLFLMFQHVKSGEKKRDEEIAKKDLELQQMRQQLIELQREFEDYKALHDVERHVQIDMELKLSEMKSICRMVREDQEKLKDQLLEEVNRFDQSYNLLEGGILNFNNMITDQVNGAAEKSTKLADVVLDVDMEHIFMSSISEHSNDYLELVSGDMDKLKRDLHFHEYLSKYEELKDDVSMNLAMIHGAGYESSYIERFGAMLRWIPVNTKIVYNGNQHLVKLKFLDCFVEEWSINIMKKHSLFEVGLEKHNDVHVYKLSKTIGLYFGEDFFANGIPSVTVCNPRQLYKLRLPSTSKDDLTVRINFETLEKSNYVMDGEFILLRITDVPKMQIDSRLLNRINSFSSSFNSSLT